MRYSFSICHVPGKYLYTADVLSRSPLLTTADDTESTELETSAELFISTVVSNLPATSNRLKALTTAQSEDQTLQHVRQYCREGWPEKQKLADKLKPFWLVRSEFSLHDNLLLHSNRIVIPESLQQEVLGQLHEGHQGIVKCQNRARISVWWPGISKQLEKFILKCPTCCKNFQIVTEPLITTELPSRPWEKVASDLYEFKGASYILVVDYFSRFIETQKLGSTTSSSIIAGLKSIFARHGIPDTLVTDNGPQYFSSKFKLFAEAYNFSHVTSSPYYPRGNGEAERAVRTLKNLLKDAKDPYLALMSYRATPLPLCNLSPTQLLIGRRIRTVVPEADGVLVPSWPNLTEFRKVDEQYKKKQKS